MAEFTQDQIEAISKKVAREVLHEMLLLSGVNTEDAAGVIDIQKDFQYLREARQGRDEFIKKGKWALITVFGTGALAILVKGLVAWVQSTVNGGG